MKSEGNVIMEIIFQLYPHQPIAHIEIVSPHQYILHTQLYLTQALNDITISIKQFNHLYQYLISTHTTQQEPIS